LVFQDDSSFFSESHIAIPGDDFHDGELVTS
jgi:hypothetical protein